VEKKGGVFLSPPPLRKKRIKGERIVYPYRREGTSLFKPKKGLTVFHLLFIL